ncbi:MAG: CDP-glucose 4,6-dehydratase [Deltaproteobacteria bacterium]|nr:CDP-glucose 4,6-dehydratase [Deltaproteobacteria bacterium]
MEGLTKVPKGKRVLLTGHTGFKGAWLALELHSLGAEVHGFSLPEAPPAAYSALGVRSLLKSEKLGDLRDFDAFSAFYDSVEPELVLHLAAQSLVRESYKDPLGTVATNVQGTAHVLEALRRAGGGAACVVVTSDKCYENRESGQAYRETDPMGGHDLYSASKGAAEIITASYRSSFGLNVASARAGNVIGGGDYAVDRIAPDCARALATGQVVRVRNPASVRPWQHVLEPLSGYLALAERLLGPKSAEYREGWNFGPGSADTVTVGDFAKNFVAEWGSGKIETAVDPNAPHEAKLLHLDVEKARTRLGWQPTWNAERAIRETVEWYKKYEAGPKVVGSMRDFSLEQIKRFTT